MSTGIAVTRGNFRLYKTHKSILLSASVPRWGPGQPPNPSPVGGPAVSGSHATQILLKTLLLNTLFSLSHDSSHWLIFDTHRNWVSQMWTQKQTVNLLLKGTVTYKIKGFSQVIFLPDCCLLPLSVAFLCLDQRLNRKQLHRMIQPLLPPPSSLEGKTGYLVGQPHYQIDHKYLLFPSWATSTKA